MFKLNEKRIGEQKIDSGNYGAVFPYQKSANDLKWVVKRIHANDTDEMLKTLPEIVLGFSCDHPCIVPLKGYNIQKGSVRDYYVYLKFPRMKENLQNRFEQQRRKKIPFTEQEIVQYFYSLVSAVDYLHAKKIYHRDIKPANVLLDHQGNAKLCDIGVAKYIVEEETDQLTEKKGTVNYFAPEICQEKEMITKESLRAGDVWSLGLVMLELCVLEKRLFNPRDTRESIQKVQEGLKKVLKEKYAGKLVDLIFQLLKLNPNERIKITAVKKKLEEEYQYCQNFEIDPEKEEERRKYKILSENKRELEQKVKKRAQEMMKLVQTLKQEKIKIQNELKEYQSFVKKFQSQIFSDINRHYDACFFNLKVKFQLLDQERIQKNDQDFEFKSRLKSVEKIEKVHLIETHHSRQKKIESSDLNHRSLSFKGMEHNVKVGVFGFKGSGKRSFITRFTNNNLSEQTPENTFPGLAKKTIMRDGKKIVLNLWETVSDKNMGSRGLGLFLSTSCDVFLIFYDITDRYSFKNFKYEKNRIIDTVKETEIVFFLGTKLDLQRKRMVSQEEANAFAEDIRAIYFEISTETGENMEEFQEILTTALLAKYWPSAVPTIIQKKKFSFWERLCA